MRKRVVLVYNPHSSHYKKIEKKVLRPAEELNNFQLYEFEVEKVAIEKNIKALADTLMDGDLVVVAGGDGTATMALNAIFSSNKNRICFGVLGFGNFNDVAASIGNNDFEELINMYGADEVREVWPL
jgi:diacylglycerol kinase family enzyme